MASERKENSKKSKRTTFKKRAAPRSGVKNANTTNYTSSRNTTSRTVTSFRGRTSNFGANKKINKGANKRANSIFGTESNKENTNMSNNNNDDSNWMQENKDNDNDNDTNDTPFNFSWNFESNANDTNDTKTNDNDNNQLPISPELLAVATKVKDAINAKKQRQSSSQPRYRKTRCIEKGKFDEVHVIRYTKSKKKGTLFVLKMIKRNSLKYKKSSKLNKNEINWKQIEKDLVDRHQTSMNVININELWVDSEYINICMGKAQTNLAKILAQSGDVQNEDTLKYYFLEIVNGLNEIHKLGFIHRDLKPSHILIQKGHIKISDLGLQRYFANEVDEIIKKYQKSADTLKFDKDGNLLNDDNNDNGPQEGKKEEKSNDDNNNNDTAWNAFNPFGLSQSGPSQRAWKWGGFNPQNLSRPKTTCYLSPDVFNNIICDYDEMTDWWSLGIILYQCIMGNQVPFNSPNNNDMEICHKIDNWRQFIKMDELSNFIVDFDHSVIDLLRNLICGKRRRFGYDKILKHRWLKNATQKAAEANDPIFGSMDSWQFDNKFDFSSESKTNDANDSSQRTTQRGMNRNTSKQRDKPRTKGNASSNNNNTQTTNMWNSWDTPSIFANKDFGFNSFKIKRETFRDALKCNKIPLSISSVDLFGDYQFDTNTNSSSIGISNNDNLISGLTDIQAEGKETTKQSLFYPSYSCAKSAIPDALLPAKSKENEDKEIAESQQSEMNMFEYFMTVNLNSEMKENDYDRYPLNLVICLDISGSMNATFDDKWDPEWKLKDQHKIAIAKKCINGVLDHLNEKDSFGLVLFNDASMIFQNLESISKLDITDLKQRISLYIEAAGGTNMVDAYKTAVSMLSQQKDTTKMENRIIFLTDEKPESEQKMDKSSLFGMVNEYNDTIYSTMIGVGIDFDGDLIEKITNIRGANYYSIHSEKEFIQTLDHDFDLMINPLLFDLKLSLEFDDDDNCGIQQIYGLEDDECQRIIKSGEIMRFNTLFPTKQMMNPFGGNILLKLGLDQEGDTQNVKICVSYEDKDGQKHKTEQNVTFNNNSKETEQSDYFENESIRKGVLLARYYQLLYEWIEHDKHFYDVEKNLFNTLKVSPIFLDKFLKFLSYFQNEMEKIKDNGLKKEIEILQKLVSVEEFPSFGSTTTQNSGWGSWNFNANDA